MGRLLPRFKNASIRLRILGISSALSTLTVLVGAWGIWAFVNANHAFRMAATEILPAVDGLVQVDRDMLQAVVAERSLMFLSMATPAAKDHVKAHDDNLAQLTEHWKKYLSIGGIAAEQKLWSSFESAANEWKKSSSEVIKILAEDTPAARRDAIDLSMGEGQAKFQQARKILGELVNIRLAQAKEYVLTQNSRVGWIHGVLISAVIAAIVLAVVLSLLLIRIIVRPLGETVALLKDIAEGEGDLTKRLAIKSRDEIGELSRWFNIFVEKIENTVCAVASNARSLAGSADQLNSVSQEMNSNSEETAAQANVVSAASEQVSKSVQTVAAGAEEMSSSIKEIAKNTSDAARVAKEAVAVAEQTNQTIAKLGASSAEIGNVIKVITSIAEQTNLLALNATIEAARAGEAGKGFAVVANEVKELAKQTGNATEDIGNKISTIQQDTQGAVAAIQQVGGIIDRVNDIAKTIAVAVEEQSVTTNDMSRSVAEAAKGSNEIVQNITGVAQSAQNTASGAAQTQSAARALAQLASELQRTLDQFKYADSLQRPTALQKANEITYKAWPVTRNPTYGSSVSSFETR